MFHKPGLEGNEPWLEDRFHINSASTLNEGDVPIQVVRFFKNVGFALVATLLLCKTTHHAVTLL